MSAPTILTMADGHGIDLLAVTARDICFPTLAEHLGKENRYNGATAGVTYSVAQHLCLGADAILADGGTEAEAGYFLLHDVQEGIWKDDPTPKKRAIAERISERCGVTADSVLRVLAEIVDEHDVAIHEAAGVAWPIPEAFARTVKLYDLRMFVTEWRDLMGGIEHPNWAPYANIPAIEARISPWRWFIARDRWLERARRLLPAMRVVLEKTA